MIFNTELKTLWRDRTKPCPTISCGRFLLKILTNRPYGAIICVYGPVAQLGERCVRNAEAEGSIPFRSTKSCGSVM